MKFIKDNFKSKVSLKNGIIDLGVLSNIKQKTVNLFNMHPFPNVMHFESKIDLVLKTEQNYVIKDLKKHIGFKKSFIDVGSGTCQLSLNMAIGTNNEIIAFDPAIETLKLGKKFASENKIKNINFVRGDIFDNPIQDEYFDFVWCYNVLHYTDDPQEGFKIISKWLKPGGTIIIGLYNSYGRFRFIFRKVLYKILGSGSLSRYIISYLDPKIRYNTSKEHINTVLTMKYLTPIEKSFTLDKVLNWFSNENIDCTNCY